MSKPRQFRSRRGLWLRRLLPAALLPAARWLRDRLTPQGRTRRWLETNQSAQLLQPSPLTWADRHPQLFALARDRLGANSALRVLSFGCSTGEEALTLAQYLPGARIDAVDINPRSIAQAQRAQARIGNTSVHFACAGEPPHERAVYDAIFCLSVLRHGELDAERPANCAQILPFARFAETIAAFDRALKPGGLLLLWGTNFRFADTPAAARYRAVEVAGKKPNGGAVYGPDNGLIEGAANAAFVFEKLSEEPVQVRAQ